MRNKRAVVVSTNYEDKYLFFLPLIHYAWAKIGWDVICMMPSSMKPPEKYLYLISQIFEKSRNGDIIIVPFNCSKENEVLYTQCSRLYAGNLDVPEYEVFMTSDIDMLPLSNYWNPEPD